MKHGFVNSIGNIYLYILCISNVLFLISHLQNQTMYRRKVSFQVLLEPSASSSIDGLVVLLIYSAKW